ncbi:MAG TPA: TlpA disulfide reductase family protein [Solirubrobacteraceae bacterium]|jgi:cytochrome c biogenesis protein CcmG/thiol:disulfide interchange protein DsbE|nr:TlpA disulfide reductase family protein [Solirubrobacteraceae bacterium]
MPRPRTLLIATAVVAALVAFVVFGLAGSKGNDGRPAPPLPLERLSGSTVTLAALRGRPVLVSFWASWCEPCEHEAPVLERFARGLHGRATLVGVNWEDLSLANARKFIHTYGWTFPNLRDPDGNVGRDYGMIGGPPVTFVIDSSGHLRAQLRGPQTQQTLTQALASVGA